MNTRLGRITFLPMLLTVLVLMGATPFMASAGAVPGPAPTFAAPTPLTTNQGSQMVVMGDFNGDGNMDLASTNVSPSTVSILPGPAFTTLVSFLTVPANALSQPLYLSVGDLNKDGKADLVVANRQDNSVSILINSSSPFPSSGNPTFLPPVVLPVGTNTQPVCVAIADVNADTKLDFVTANFGTNNVTLFFGDGLGGITPAATKTYTVPFTAPVSGSNPNFVAFGDMNRDGKLDLLVAANVAGQLWVYLNNGTADPYSGAPASYNTAANPIALAIADMNGDLNPDVVVSANGLSGGIDVVSVFFGNGDGTLGTSPCASGCGPGQRLDLPGVGAGPFGVVAGDLNGDSYPDIVVVDQSHGASDGVKVLLGNGLGCFGNTASAGIPPACGSWLPVVLVPGTQSAGIGMGDLNGDGKPDLFVANSGSPGANGITVFTNTLAGATACAANISPPSCITNHSTCISMDVNLSNLVLPTSGAVRGFSVTLRLSSNLQLCTLPAPNSFLEGNYLSLSGVGTPRLTEFHVTSNPDGSFTIDDAILDPVTPPTTCGPTASSGRLFTVNVTALAGAIGTGSVTVTGFTLRDCANGPLTAFSCPSIPASGTITIKRVDPLPATALTQSQKKTGNPAGQVTGINLGWTLPASDPSSPTSSTRVEIYRAPFLGTGATALLSGYPDYLGAGPIAPASYPPSAPWVLATTIAPSTSQQVAALDTPPTRGYWYYALYRVDNCNSPSTILGPPSVNAGTLNYHLGDVAKPGGAICEGDNLVNGTDFATEFSVLYGATIPYLDPRGCYDFGPTVSGTVDGRPKRDVKIQFEDLILWAINFTRVSAPQFAGSPVTADHNELALDAPETVHAGETFTVSLRLKGAGDLQGLSTQLSWDAAVASPIAVDAGALANAQDAVVLSAGPGNVDAAVLGVTRQGLAGDGVLASVRFRAAVSGKPAVAIASSDGRDRTNSRVFVAGGSQPGPLATAFAPVSPNPFTRDATLAFSLARGGQAELAIYSVDGRRVRTLASGARASGAYRLSWDGTDDAGRPVSPGLFFARLSTVEGRFTRSLVMLK